MPVAYQRGILEEHSSTRRFGGLFDISHMGRFLIRGIEAVPFMQHVLTNNVTALDPGVAQYTLIQNEEGGSIDDAYVYRLEEEDPSLEANYLLVVNAANREKDWNWFLDHKKQYKNVAIDDKTDEIGMIALQGPQARKVLEKILLEDRPKLPDPWRNRLRVCELEGEHVHITISRTGYTGEPICFELFLAREEVKAHMGEDPRRRRERGDCPGRLRSEGYPEAGSRTSPLWSRVRARCAGNRYPHLCGPFRSKIGHEFLSLKRRIHRKGYPEKAI